MHASLTRRLDYIYDHLEPPTGTLEAQFQSEVRLLRYAVSAARGYKHGYNAREAISDAENLALELANETKIENEPNHFSDVYRWLHEAYNESCTHPE